MSTRKPHKNPSEVSTEGTEVIVDGPTVAASLTPTAKLQTSDRLMEAGLKAKGREIETDRENPAQAHRPQAHRR